MDEIAGIVVAGHGVASGRAGDPRFPEGTLALQWAHFEGAGLNLRGFYRGTVNVSVAPFRPRPVAARLTVRKVQWHEHCPPEDFSFFDVRVAFADGSPVEALVYWPHPETKPDHFQDPHVVEILAPFTDGVEVGSRARVWGDERQIEFRK